MLIKVKLFSSLRGLKPNSSVKITGDTWEVPEKTTLKQILNLLQLAEKKAIITLVNGCHATDSRMLMEGDVLHIFPPMFGG